MKAKLLTALIAFFGANAFIFTVFFFDLDGKFLFYVYKPFMIEAAQGTAAASHFPASCISICGQLC